MTDEEIKSALLDTRDNLIKVRQAVLSKPKPSYSIDGQEVRWTEYLKQLDASILKINAEIDASDGPFEEVSVAYSGP